MTAQRSSFGSPPSGTPNYRSGDDPNVYPAGATSPQPVPAAADDAMSDSVVAAVAYISTHVAGPLTTETIARAAGVSPGESERGFRTQFGISPMQYVHRLRLEGVRAELQSTTDEPLAAIIGRWGFVHVGRFAEAYSRRYGARPGP
ncbi:helix-turn-helix domain-containing protein [Curtobacterium sp. RRHDQ66]|uniref:helix-turn-helix domain-containing protein n=1 Tax=Curtobacterium guangdongense TaxID=3413380 RepID=UPI003BF13741